jgi:thioredoxin reductase (NADPH)
MESIRNVDILILGAGPAGLTAGIYAARSGAKTVIVENMVTGGAVNSTVDICNYPGFERIGGAELGEKMAEHAKSAGCEIVLDEVESFDFNKKTVKLVGETVQYRSLIICMGAKPRKLGIENEEEYIGNGIHFCALCDGEFYAGRDVIVVGGGNSAAEDVIYMQKIAKSVTMIVDKDKLSAQQAIIDEIDKKVKIRFGAGIAKILTAKDKVTGVELKNGDTVKCDGIFVCIGRTPNTELFRGSLEMSKGGYIVVDANMQTSAKSVYAAGDIIEKSVRQVITACADGAIAATYAVK